ncbi:DUF4231 domain-containing protein [Rhizobium leguminosarum]|uniref:DUF4231 domain-containing protein n=1 Tax=Rhizobium leguminosarum TaxID=384 RepID=UPI001C988832|nr:DUF4231 domain-containing protein [Rhizobium leguminosarum]MBY5523563.1 DUF4231 domain-containing protein [Rhizobium leguminosarum]
MTDIDYPALYLTANASSRNGQQRFLAILICEYCLLVIAAILSMNLSTNVAYNVASAVVFFALIIFLLVRSLMSLDRDWYNGRAIAESIKTLTWKFMMQAHPFAADQGIASAEAAFVKLLHQILNSNKELGKIFSAQIEEGDQITEKMRTVRAGSLGSRRSFYAKERIADQLGWYTKKAKWNGRRFILFIVVLCVVYAIAAISALTRIRYPDFAFYPTEPLIAVAGGIIGWIQIKRFNELSAAYTLTAHEIGLTKAMGGGAGTEEKFAEHVNDAELAFSREHTQWIARQAG